ncbi:MAG TPA: hypothetical protein VG406_03695 [Isosphaeraceae bacterium]|jgi:hypothetical protein|nr:hypothetical protein [Isosphaeraceae bacterium]
MKIRRIVGYSPFGTGLGDYDAALCAEAPSPAQERTEADLRLAYSALSTVAGAAEAAAAVARYTAAEVRPDVEAGPLPRAGEESIHR